MKLKLTPSAASNISTDRCVLLSFHKKTTNASYNTFFNDWKQRYGPRFANVNFVKTNMNRYEHTYKDVAKSEELAGSTSILPYDVMALHEATHYDRLSIWNNPEAFFAFNTTQFTIPRKVVLIGQAATFIDRPLSQGLETGEGRVRVVFLLKRKPGVSIRQFQQHWGEIHSQIFSGIGLVQRNIVHYEQVHVDHAATAKLAAKFGYDPLPFDGIAIEEAESWEKLLEVLLDAEAMAPVAADEANFLDRESLVVLPAESIRFV